MRIPKDVLTVMRTNLPETVSKATWKILFSITSFLRKYIKKIHIIIHARISFKELSKYLLIQ